MLISAAYCDIRYKRIYNYITVPAIVIALIVNYEIAGVRGVISALGGGVIASFPFIIVYALKGIGAGDVKLIAAVCTMSGMPCALYIIFYTTLIGFIMAVWALIKEGGTADLFKVFLGRKKTSKTRTIPYGLAIVAGAYIAFFVNGF